ncbi:MAG: HD domain-containing protein [Pseudomonadota bacterium]
MIRLFIPEPVRFVLDRLRTNQFKSYVVGGAVRDALLNKSCEDMDILTHATLEQIKNVFSDQNVKIVGKTFSVCLVNGIEVAAPRLYMNGPDITGSDITGPNQDIQDFLHSDLSCRDFTINAMAWDPDTFELIDPLGGQKDLAKRLIRFTLNPEQRIKQDPVRMIRACRFLSLMDGTIDPASRDMIISLAGLIETSTAQERIKEEIIKAMALEKPSLFFTALKTMGLLEKIFPSLDRCYGLDGGPFHGETVFEHCLLVGDALSAKQPFLRLAGFLHDTGKFDAAHIKDGRLTFAGHQTRTRAVAKDLSRLKFSNNDITYIIALIRTHMRPLSDETTPKAARRLLAMLDQNKLCVQDFMRIRIADKKGNLKKQPYTFNEIRVRLEKLYNEIKPDMALSVNRLNITGNDIIKLMNIDSGPQVGKIKQILFERVLDDPSLNTHEKLIKICQSLKINE